MQLFFLGLIACSPSLAVSRRHGQEARQVTESGLIVDWEVFGSPDGGTDGKGKKDKVKELENKVQRSAARTKDHIKHSDEIPHQFEVALEDARKTFLPRLNIDFFGICRAAGTALFGAVCFIIYFTSMYTSDRSESLDRWKKELAASGTDNVHGGMNPDMIFVFHHPGFEYDDGNSEVSAASLRRILVPKSDRPFKRLEELREVAEKAEAQGDVMCRSLGRSITNWMRKTTTTHHSDAEEEDVKIVTKRDVRIALLKDLHEALPAWGFDLTLFSSIDDDELFVCITLLHRKAIDYFLSRNNVQLQLNTDVVAQLGIAQDPDDPACSPPSVPYDSDMVKQLADQDILDSEDDALLFKTWEGRGPSSVISSQECIRIIWNELLGYLDPLAAAEEGFLVTSYPVHSSTYIAQLRATWANWSLLWDMSFVQPVGLLKEYFGTRIAFTFAWNGHFCKALLPLCAIAIIQQTVVFVSHFILDMNLLTNTQILGFSIVVVLWARISVNLWQRHESFFLESWNVRQNQNSKTARPQFEGTFVPSPIDGNLLEKRFPAGEAFYRRTLTAVSTMLFCAVVALAIIGWMLLFEGQMGIISSLMLSMQIKVFEAIFNILVKVMTDYENHQYPDQYHDSLLWKLFLFNFVNNYCAFFCITVRQAWQNGHCEGGDCTFILRRQLSITLSILCMCSIAAMVVSSLLVRFSLWYEAYQVEKKTSKPMASRYAIEEQAKYALISESVEVENTMTLVMSLGFIFLFGGIAPLCVPFCFIIFAVQMRWLAILLTTDAQRTFPAESMGIGNWSRCINFLLAVGVLYSGFMMVAFGEMFHGSKLLAKMTGMMAFCLAAAVLWSILDIIIPSKDPKVALLIKRRDYVSKALMKAAGAEMLKAALQETRAGASTGAGVAGDFREAVQDETWDKIPQLHAMPVSNRTPTRTLSVHSGRS